MRIVAQILTVFLFILLFLLSITKVFAATTSYLVTSGFIALPPSIIGVGRVLLYTIMTFDYKTGPLVFSLNPDGTGDAAVGDALNAYNVYPSAVFNYNAQTNCAAPDTLMPPEDVSSYLVGQGLNNITVRYLDWCGGTKTMSQLYLVNLDFNDYSPKPFLDLPWDYEGKGFTFTEAALSINSYFDHEYPLLSNGLSEPSEASDTLISFQNSSRTDRSYSSHDGYDYGKPAEVNIGDWVLAAGDGEATYINSCGACGNMIVIDHKNGYQTRYLHLQKDGLITSVPNQKIWVEARQQIGKVGATGNVIPAGDLGAHIHFGVFRDKNLDGNFDDNVPDGVTDPFGWQSSSLDPWSAYAFTYNDQERTGAKSFYLWKNKLDSTSVTLTGEGGSFTAGRYTADFPSGATSADLSLTMQPAPVVDASASVTSIGTTFDITAKDNAGNIVTEFLIPFTLSVDFSQFDLSKYNLNTFSFYSSSDGQTWVKEDTNVDLENKKASTQINHLTQFAFMAEKTDILPPVTIASFSGVQSSDNHFRSDVQLFLNASDQDGSGVDYVLYKKGDEDWLVYNEPLLFDQEGEYNVTFYSADKNGNIENLQTVTFDIDKTPPEFSMQFDSVTRDIVFSGKDSSSSATLIESQLADGQEEFTVSDTTGNTLIVLAAIKKDANTNSKININSLQYNDGPIIVPDKNRFIINSLFDKNVKATIFNQIYEVKDKEQIRLRYSPSKNSTKVTIKQNGEPDNNLQFDGLKILRIDTVNGMLQYSY